MARRKRRSSKRGTREIGGLRTLGGANLGYNYLIGGKNGFNAIKNGNFSDYMFRVETKLQSPAGEHFKNALPLLVGIGGKKLFGRHNPGITFGKYRIKLF